MTSNIIKLLTVAAVAIAIACATDSNSATTNATFLITWDTPTQREDNSPLPRAEIAKYQIEWSIPNSATRRIKTAKAGTNEYLMYLPPGEYSFRMRTFDDGGIISAWTAPVIKRSI